MYKNDFEDWDDEPSQYWAELEEWYLDGDETEDWDDKKPARRKPQGFSPGGVSQRRRLGVS